MRKVLPLNARLVPPQAKRVFKGMIYDTYQWQQELFDGSQATFEMLKRPDTIEVLAVKDNKIVVIEEEQPGRPPFKGLPGGRHDVESEDELAAAKREMVEETGLSFKNWKLIEVIQPHNKIEQFVYFFLATEPISEVSPHLDPGEKIEVHYISLEDFKRLIDDPKTRTFPREVIEKLNKVSTIDDLLNLPEYEGQPVKEDLEAA